MSTESRIHPGLVDRGYWGAIDEALYALYVRESGHLSRRLRSVPFSPGDIAICTEKTSVKLALVDYIRSRGITLNREEWGQLQLDATLTNSPRYVVILEDRGDGEYLVCFITTFHDTPWEDLRPIIQNFAIPYGNWSRIRQHGIKPIKAWPQPEYPGYIYATPVVRRTIGSTYGMRRSLVPGDLGRLQRIIAERVKVSTHTM